MASDGALLPFRIVVVGPRAQGGLIREERLVPPFIPGTRPPPSVARPRALCHGWRWSAGLRRGARVGVESAHPWMKYFTTVEVANELEVSKQTLLNWLYAGKVPEPPRNRSGYRLWSPSRVSLVKRL